MNKITIIVLCSLIAYINCHGSLVLPASRGSGYKLRPDEFPRVKQDDADMCESPNESKNYISCGVCGPVYDNDVTASRDIQFRKGIVYTHSSFEKGGPYYTGKIAETYSKGQTIEALVQINAGHRGNFQFFICNADGIENPTNDCMVLLQDDQGRDEMPQKGQRELTDSEKSRQETFDRSADYNSDDGVWTMKSLYKFNIVLPADLTCEHCIFQWRWVSAIGQIYRSCSDISIIE